MAKLVDYLLVPQPESDKSKFLAQVGFTRFNPETLEAAIRWLIADSDAHVQRVDDFGTYYYAEGKLHGPGGILGVVTIWVQPQEGDEVRFVTLKPARRTKK